MATRDAVIVMTYSKANVLCLQPQRSSMHAYTNTTVCMWVCARVYVCVCVRTSACVCVRLHVCMSARVCACVCVCVLECMCVVIITPKMEWN